METTTQEEAVGWRGGREWGGEACSGFWCWPPCTLSLQVELYSSSIYKQALFLLPLHPTEHHPEWPVAPRREPRAGCACVGGAVAGGCQGRSPLLYYLRLEKAGAALRAVWFWRVLFGFCSYYFGSPFSLSPLASLTPKHVQ